MPGELRTHEGPSTRINGFSVCEIVVMLFSGGSYPDPTL